MTKWLDGKKIAEEILASLSEKIKVFPRKIGLAVLLVGENPASLSYIRMKKRACAKLGIHFELYEFPAATPMKALLHAIDRLNCDNKVDGILVQAPLPSQLNILEINRAIDPAKDIDGFHPLNAGKLLLGETDGFIPCTPHGIKILLERSQIDIAGKHVVILGRSNIVGKPLAALLVQKQRGCNATVTIAHSQSLHLREITLSADILVAAIGQPKLITGEMVKVGSIVVDVGNNRVQNDAGAPCIVGDVDFASVAPIASRITPVPGGVGPMTIAMLLQNTYESAHRRG